MTVDLLDAETKQKMTEEFLRSLLNPDMFGFSVSAEVRDQARILLGLKPVEQEQYHVTRTN